MKTYSKIILAATIFGSGLWLGSSVISKADGVLQNNQPGDVNDPLVTKSYVDSAVQKLVNDQVTKIEADLKSKQSGNTSITIVQLKAGETLYASDGTEFIVRNGKTTAVSTDGNGIPDVTGGKDIANGQPIADNHLLLFPRQGRGIKADPKTTGTINVMVRGDFLHMDKNGKQIN